MPKIPLTDGEETLGDDYPANTAIKEIFISRIAKALVVVKNTHATKGLKAKIIAYADRNDKTDTAVELLTEIVVAAGNVLKDVDGKIPTITDPWDSFQVFLKNELAGDNTTVKGWVLTKPLR